MQQWDVFSSRPLQGNSLAVFLDGRGLGDGEMQSIAREMNLSETTFILPRDPAIERERGIRVRIFTVQEELPFAGHPTLGTAFALRALAAEENQTGALSPKSSAIAKPVPQTITLELNVGQVPVTFEDPVEDPENAPTFGEMTQVNPTFGMQHDRAAVARAIGIPLTAFDPSLPIQSVSTGLPYTIAPLKSLATIQRLTLDLNRAAEYLERTEGKFFYFVCRETVDPKARLHARMLFYNGEDPATGSAAGCASAWMVAHGVAQADEHVLIEQGLEMDRPSRIFVRAAFQENPQPHSKQDGQASGPNPQADNRVVNVRVGGHAVEIMRGEVFL
jgi:trans-2,3-dihydro-3-hydroxyanthranilate isomerase